MKRAFLVCLLVGVVAASGIAAAAPAPNLTAALADDTVAPGQETDLTVVVSNAPDVSASGYTAAELSQATTARNVRVTMEDDNAPIDVKSGTQVLRANGQSQLTEGAALPTSFHVAVDRNAEPGTYTVPVEVTYIYSIYDGGVRDDKKVTETLDVTLEVKDEPRFEVVDTSTNASVGDTGTTRLTLQNVGSEPADDARVTVSPQGSQFVVGGGSPVTAYVGSWAVDQNRTVTVSSSVAADADAQNYTLDAQVTYANENGNTERSDSLLAAVRPLPEQTFELGDVESTLRAGEDGTLNATVTNTGPTAVANAVVTLSSTSANVVPGRSEYAVGSVAAGESVPVSFPVDVTDSAEAGPRQLDLGVRYRNDAGDARQSDDLPATVDIAPERDRFVVEPVDDALAAGSGDTVTFRLTNNGDTAVTNVNAKVYADDPISTSDDQAFVSRLEAGETTNVSFSLSASGSALEKTYPVSMDFQYDTGGETKLSNYYQVPLSVTAPEGGSGPPIALIGGVVLVVVIAGGYLYYRRQ